jgi:hypothetical protein
MNAVMLLARIVLALVFGMAGIAKIFDLKRSRTAVADFGLPDWIAAPIGLCLPFAELSIAGLLLPITTVWWGAVGSVVLSLRLCSASASTWQAASDPIATVLVNSTLSRLALPRWCGTACCCSYRSWFSLVPSMILA